METAIAVCLTSGAVGYAGQNHAPFKSLAEAAGRAR